jgi:hypothetical protein
MEGSKSKYRKKSKTDKKIEHMISLHTLKFVEKVKILARSCYRQIDELLAQIQGRI